MFLNWVMYGSLVFFFCHTQMGNYYMALSIVGFFCWLRDLKSSVAGIEFAFRSEIWMTNLSHLLFHVIRWSNLICLLHWNFEIFGTLGMVVVGPFYLWSLFFETSNFEEKVVLWCKHLLRETLLVVFLPLLWKLESFGRWFKMLNGYSLELIR